MEEPVQKVIVEDHFFRLSKGGRKLTLTFFVSEEVEVMHKDKYLEGRITQYTTCGKGLHDYVEIDFGVEATQLLGKENIAPVVIIYYRPLIL